MKCFFAILLSAFLFAFSRGQGIQTSSLGTDHIDSLIAEFDSLQKQLNLKAGEVILGDNLAILNVPDSFDFLDSNDAQTVLNTIWNNPEKPDVLGMLIPKGISVLDDACWGVVFTYVNDGHVNDKEACSINNAKLLRQMKKAMASSDATETQKGLLNIKLINWAQEPVYDSITHKLYWATELQNVEDSIKTLNYNIRFLGRNGVLVLNVIAGFDQLPEINMHLKKIMNSANFTKGNWYEDYDETKDKIATYNIEGLIAGGNLPKTGTVSKVSLFIVQQWKVIGLTIALLLIVLLNFLSKRNTLSSEED